MKLDNVIFGNTSEKLMAGADGSSQALYLMSARNLDAQRWACK